MFKKLHKNGSFRLNHFDYGQNGYYFVTICTKSRHNYFGVITNGKINYNPLGNIAIKYWQKIAQHFSFVIIDEFIVMPDHIHGIIVIDKTRNDAEPHYVGAHNYARLPVRQLRPGKTKFYKNTFGPQSKNLASIIRSYKIAVQTYANRHCIPFAWQPRYYDRIIRNERELTNVRRYIRNNPTMYKYLK